MVLPKSNGIYHGGSQTMNESEVVSSTTSRTIFNDSYIQTNYSIEGNITLFNSSIQFRNVSFLNNLTTTQRTVIDHGGNEVVYQGPPPQGLPIPLLIASPVAAVSILIFVCVAYYCHAAQLDARARELAIKMASGEMDITLTTSVTTSSILSNNDSDTLLLQKRRSTLRPSPTPPPSVCPGGKPRGSVNWSALADHELVTYSAPRRHSTFII